jgi:hypothetical protein
VSSPRPTAATTTPTASAASRAECRGGKSITTRTSLRGGRRRSMHRRRAVVSPARARSTALRVRASASPSSSARAAWVLRLRAPFGRPGLPTPNLPFALRGGRLQHQRLLKLSSFLAADLVIATGRRAPWQTRDMCAPIILTHRRSARVSRLSPCGALP